MDRVLVSNTGTFALLRKCSKVATYMKMETENEINAHVRRVYEPRYGRELSDAEVCEIRTNLRTFAEGIMSVAERLYGRTDNPGKYEDGIHDLGHEV